MPPAAAAAGDLTLTAVPDRVGIGGSAGAVDLAYAGGLPGSAALELSLVTDAPAVAGVPVLGTDDVVLTADGAPVGLAAGPDGRTLTPTGPLARPAQLTLGVDPAGGTAAADLAGTTLVLTLRVVDGGTELDVEQRVVDLVVPGVAVDVPAGPTTDGVPAAVTVRLTAPAGVSWTGLPVALALSAPGLTPGALAVEEQDGSSWRGLPGTQPVAGTVLAIAGGPSGVDVAAGTTTTVRLRLTAAPSAPTAVLAVAAAAFLAGQDPLAGEPFGTAGTSTTLGPPGAAPPGGPSGPVWSSPAGPGALGSGAVAAAPAAAPAAAVRAGGLASTGADLAVGVLGAALVAAGSLLVVAGRRRRASTGGAA
ncbi:hypothetical protein [Trujillonella humicola]|uniref:hypothetical protein n=1 Tax=Trujillonella humicola TaxID=3383699 RepID=UPI0039058531